MVPTVIVISLVGLAKSLSKKPWDIGEDDRDERCCCNSAALLMEGDGDDDDDDDGGYDYAPAA